MGSKEKSQSLRLHLLRYTFTVAEVIRKAAQNPINNPIPYPSKWQPSNKPSRQPPNPHMTKKTISKSWPRNPLSQQSNNHNTAPRADNTCCLLEQRDTDLLLFVSRGSPC